MYKKKVLFGITYYLPNISGVTQYAVILAEELAKRKYLVEVLSAKFKKELDEEKMINEVKVIRVKGFGLGKGFIMPYYWIESLKRVRENEVIVCHLPSIESFWLALWGKLFHKKVIIIHHCEFSFSGTVTNKIIAGLSFPIHLFTYAMADKITAYTKDYAQHSTFLRMFKNKIEYILPPIKIEETDKKFNLGKEKIVGFVGRIGWEKGLVFLIEAMKKIEAKLVLAGPYQEVVGDKTYEKLKKIIDKKIIFYGPINHKDLKGFYNQCDCLVLPSINNLETFGIVQAEAMKCGVPVVASNLPGVRVPVKMTGMGEICKIENSQDLAEKINLVLKRGKKYYQNRAKNLEDFSYLKTVDAFERSIL